MNKWSVLIDKMINGEVPFANHYILTEQTGSGMKSGALELVTPTQVAVQQAKSDVKRKIIENIDTNKRLKTEPLLQSGTGKSTNNIKTAPRKTVKPKTKTKKIKKKAAKTVKPKTK